MKDELFYVYLWTANAVVASGYFGYKYATTGLTATELALSAGFAAILALFIYIHLDELDKASEYYREKREREAAEEERDRLQAFINTVIDDDQPVQQVSFTLEEENEHASWRNDQPKTLTRMIVADSGLNSPTEDE